MSAASAFPELFHARPEWPNRDDEHLFWVGLNTRFAFAHHPVKGEDQKVGEGDVLSFFCRPGRAAEQLKSYLQHSHSGGSVLVTGYRGTGKTSLVNHCLDELRSVAAETLEEEARKDLKAVPPELVPEPPQEQRKLPSAGEVQKMWKQTVEALACKAEAPSVPGKVWHRLEKVWHRLDTCVEGHGLIKIRVNMATVTCAADVLVLTFDGLIDWVEGACAGYAIRVRELEAKMNAPSLDGANWQDIRCDRRLKELCSGRLKSLREIKQKLERKLSDLRSKSSVEHRSSPRLDQFGSPESASPNAPGVSSEQSFGREALSRHQAGLVEQIRELKRVIQPDKMVFVFDEVDKLMPVDDWVDDKPEDESREIKKLETLQQIVADLKCFLSESPSHQIFIAGKDVDDSWAEDQNRGEGIFESIFASNINVASIFTLELEPCLPPLPKEIHADAEEFYTVLAGQLGIPKNSLVYRTALLILPHLAEYEIVQLLTRAYLRKPGPGEAERKKLEKWLEAYAGFEVWDQPGLKARPEVDVVAAARVPVPAQARTAETPAMRKAALRAATRRVTGAKAELAEMKRELAGTVAELARLAPLTKKVFLWLRVLKLTNSKLTQEERQQELEDALKKAVEQKAVAHQKKALDDLIQADAQLLKLRADLMRARALHQKEEAGRRRAEAELKKSEAALERSDAGLEKARENLVHARAGLRKAGYLSEWTRSCGARTKATMRLRRAEARCARSAADMMGAEALWKRAGKRLLRASRKFLAAKAALSPQGGTGAPGPQREDHTPWFSLSPMSERTCRRLRILMEYLTYKGRGIPRKVLREFYTMVRPSNCVPNDDPGYRKLWKKTVAGTTDRYGKAEAQDEKNLRVVRHVLAFQQHHLQKMNFYASIVEHLDRNFALLRGLNDKGRVSIFHIIDYLLKFYGTGFSHRDLEHAPFMTAREELFPSRQLAALILRIMDGKLWKRKDTRSPEYRMLHHVAHDLAVMFLRYGPEQMELRHTLKDFRDEVPRLRKALDGSAGVTADQRLAPIHAQLRLARIHELCGRHYEARLGYYGAVRWLRQDICHFEQAGSTVQHVQGQAAQAGQPGTPPWVLVLPPARASAKATAQAVSQGLAPVPGEQPSSLPTAAHTPGFSVAFVSYLVECHLALGRLLEEVGEQRAAVHHYEEACSLCDPYFSHPSAVGDGHERVRIARGDDDDDDGKNKDEDRRNKDEDGRDIPRYIDYGRRLWSTLFEEERIDLPASPAGCSSQAPFDAERLARVLARRPPMRPLKLSGVPQGYVQVCNQAAIAYSKLWERSSANAYFMRALVHLDEIGDEYGLVEQIFFIGQVMVRRRDLVAAAFWYRAALLKSRSIRVHSTHNVQETPKGLTSEFREEQTGAGWQTPPVITTLEAQITAALGDVIFATGGHAFYLYKDVAGGEGQFHPARTDQEAQSAIWRFIRMELGHASPLKVDDRWEEFFFTQTRRLFEAGEHDIDARDVYLRQLESRLCRFEHAIGLLDLPAPGEESCMALNEYAALNAWTTFWRGARVLLHRNLVTVTSLARDERHMWGRIADFRRMGTTLRLIGSMLLELGLRANEAKSRKVLMRASRTLEAKGRPPKIDREPAAPVQFYHRFLGGADKSMISDAAWMDLVIDTVRNHLGTSAICTGREIDDFMSDDQLTTRINVNTASADILTIFAYLGDREDLLGTRLQDAISIEDVGGRSPLFRVNGDDEKALPIARASKSLRMPGAPDKEVMADDLACRFRLLALAEKALLSSYLCYRDCIPDFSYALSCVKMGELYVAAIYKMGEWISDNEIKAGLFTREIAQAVLGFTEHGKRFLTKAVDILNREQEQNRNTFHLMSEAWFNLADILTLRLLAVTGSTDTLATELFGPDEVSQKIVAEIGVLDTAARQRTAGSKNAGNAIRDLVPEDLRRQIQEAYQSGLRYVQSEMNDCSSRYRVPGDVLYAHRNLMDPVLHFRICSSIRLRHSGGRHDATNEGAKAIRERFDDITHDICERISGYESPQPSYETGKNDARNVGTTPSRAWAAKLSELVKFANKVRTDRGPLVVETNLTRTPRQVMVKWFSVTEPVKVAEKEVVPEQFVFYAGGKIS